MSLPTTIYNIDPDAGGPLLASYKGSTMDVTAVYCPYVPLQFAGFGRYWQASEVYEDTIPLVVIDGHYNLADSPLVRDLIEAWIGKHAKGGFYWESGSVCSPKGEMLPQCDLLRLTDMEDALLFRMTFSKHQHIA